MRLLAVLLFATTLSAQWVSPIEQSYGPYSRPQRGGRPALAVGSNGILLAWSETLGAPRIRIGLLDSRAQLISEIATLPVQAERAEAYAPAVSFNGESFLVAWVERYSGGEKIRSLEVNGSGIPITTAQTHGFVDAEDVTPLILWDGGTWHVREGSGEGVQAAMMHDGVYASGMWKVTLIFEPCGRIAICPIKAYRWDIVWTAGDKSGSERIGREWPKGRHTPPGVVGLAPAGDDFAIAWATNAGVGYRFASSTRSNTIHAYVDDDVAPGLACNDERCVIAYGTFNGDVHAIVVETDDLRSPQLLTITATERKEHSPVVHHLGSGRFLVSYLSDQSKDLRINGRIVTFGPTRQRSIR